MSHSRRILVTEDDAGVLVLTARHAADDVKRAVSIGAKDFLTKPFNENQLILRVARLLRAPITAAADRSAMPAQRRRSFCARRPSPREGPR